ncbi:uncharacterized protein F4822DRAFT_429183 [Hypoxylon trugodes]|uniref:uncharacterized protein n=1 Tax=Hypoxylon trugodes TaxID=326681 RepID=UPI00218D0137|nr:uncharacterized protein F4822DRAFT_429183 [Hypoxylon trugodes]KAI1388564.1 hypothetical protein F4822DRAFT_429183 [Hypoxylon trugodes]
MAATIDPQVENYFSSIETTEEDIERSFPIQHEVETTQAFALGSLPVGEAAQMLTSRTAKATTPFSMDSRMRTLWSFINKTSVAIPSAQPLIIQLLSEIRKLGPLVVPKEGEGVGWGIDLEDGEAWEKLPHWANDWADSINMYEVEFLSSPNNQKARAEWVSATSYSAQLTATGDPELIGDWWCYVNCFFIRRCCPSIVRVLDIASSDDCERQVLEISAAAPLFIYASQELLQRSLASDTIESMSEKDIDGERLWWGDMRMLTIQRWKHWKDRWIALKDSDILDESNRNLASEALEAMAQAEASAG